jgi:putative tricarboxylic transport membrane protein
MAFAPIILSLTGLGAIVLAWGYGFWSFGSPGAGLMPAIAGVIVICASATDIRGAGLKSWTLSRRVTAHLAALIALPFATLALGMLAALAVYLLVILTLVEHLRLRNAVLVTALAVGGSYLLFEKLLSVPLPKPPFV